MRADEMRELSDADLNGRIAELERERFNLRFKSGTQPLEDPLRLRWLRKDIARLKTIQHERALGLVRTAPAATPTKGAAKKAPAKKSAAKTTTTKRTTAKAPAKRSGGSSR